jgi:hypothetical protein
MADMKGQGNLLGEPFQMESLDRSCNGISSGPKRH